MPPDSPIVTEIAPDLFRISIYVPEFQLQFNHFLVRDDQPLLFHTGLRGLFPLVREGVATLMDPADLAFIGFSHFESDAVERARTALLEYQTGVLAEYMPYTPRTQQALDSLAELEPKTLAIMHGSSFTGDCATSLRDYGQVLREVFGER